MPGLNTTGTHSVDELQLGRGILKFALLDANGKAKGYRDLGNVPSVTATVSSETLEHYSSREGLRTLDKTVVTQQTSELSFQLENINFQNLALFYSGDTDAYVNPAIAGVTDERFVEDGDLEVNQWYTLRTSTGPAFGITTTNAIVVESTNGTPVAMVKDTDYTVNATTGQIFVEDTATVQSIITAGDGLQFTLTADPSATTVDELTILSSTSITGALRFELEDADTGKQVIYEYYQASLSSDGDYNLISDDWANLPMTASLEKSTAYGNVTGKAFYPVTQA